jgi:hypothetical protein
MGSLSSEWLLVAALALGLVAVALHAIWRRWRASWRARRRARIALAGERDAIDLLRREGYEVEAVQARRIFTVRVDGVAVEVELRADLLLRQGRRRFVADVKTGEVAPRLTTAATRRQLLEYRVAYDVDGVLLVDMASRRVHVVEFGPARCPDSP